MKITQKIEISDEELSPSEADAFLRTPKTGGIVVFIGTTRQWTGTQETTRLTYECYQEMALVEMERLADEAGKRWDLERIYMAHRTGEVAPTEASVIIGVGSAHRKNAFEACAFLIDQLKEHVPIWKREVYADGTSEWVQPGSSHT